MLLFEDMDSVKVEPLDFVTVGKDEYADLLATAEKWEMFRAFFYENIAKTKDGALAIEGYKVCDAMSIIDNQRYKEAMNG